MTYETPTGANMFAYCMNNPVMCVDTEGNSAALAGTIAGAVWGIINGAMAGGSWDEIVLCGVSGALTGGIAGFCADVAIATGGISLALGASAISSGLMGAANSAFTQSVLNDGKISFGKVVSDFVFSAVMGTASTAMANIGKPIVKGVSEGIKYVNSVIAAETYMFANELYIGATLAFDAGAAAVTSFGAWLGGLYYDAFAS